jgi:putative ubiquitin-RnfH superfamily antitoxin RatB of RatAB toxin-antitoxin module
MARAELDAPAIEVVYAEPGVQRIVRVTYTPGLTAEQAVNASGFLEEFPAIASRELVLGVFGVRVAGNRPLEPGDRVEICRPLSRDPRERRRDLAH